MLFFGSRCERLCMIQFSLISLIPGLINHLQDCADPAFDSYTQTVEKPTSLKTSERSSCMEICTLLSFNLITNSVSTCIYRLAFADIWKGMFLFGWSLMIDLIFRRAACSARIRRSSSWICWQIPVPSPMSSDLRIRFFYNKRIATVIFLLM